MNNMFASAVNYAVGGGVYEIAIADFNNDRKLDVAAVYNAYSGGFVVLLNSGNGALAPYSEYNAGDNTWTSGIAAGDFNQDSRIDLVVPYSAGSSIYIWFNSGTGTFANPSSYPAMGWYTFAVAVADFNGDGQLDIASADHGDSGPTGVDVFLNQGNKAFSDNFYSVGHEPHGVAIGDLNSDGKQDIVSATSGDNVVSVLLNSGGGSFATAVQYEVGNNPYRVAIGNLNSDSHSDIAASNINDNTISVLYNLGNGSFVPAAGHFIGSSPLGIAIGDLNGDGWSEILATNSNTTTIGVLYNLGNGIFDSAVYYTVDNEPNGIALADLNGDQRLDIITANGAGTISVLLNIYHTPTHSQSHSHTSTPTSSPSRGSHTHTMSVTPTTSRHSHTLSQSGTPTPSRNSDTLSQSHTPTATSTSSPSEASHTSTQTPSASSTSSPSKLLSASSSYSTSHTHTPTSSPRHTSSAHVSESATRSTSNSYTSSQSHSSHTQSLSGSQSSELTQTPSTLSRTQSTSITLSSTGTQSTEPTTTRSQTLSASLTPSNSAYNTATHSIAETTSKTTTPTLSRTPTQSTMPTHTPSPSQPPRANADLQDAANPSILKIHGPNDANAIGYFVSGLGDINHDGRGDFLISTSKTNTSATLDGTSCIGELYVVFGQPSIQAFPQDVLSINATNGFAIPNIQGFTYAKTATGWQTWCDSIGSAAGDLNGDGVDDFIIGNSKTTVAPRALNIGVAYVIFGKTTGFVPSLNLASLNGSNGFMFGAGYCSTVSTDGYANVFPGDPSKRLMLDVVTFSERALGSAISGGDVNGDGRADVIIGDPWNSRLTGEVTVVYGQSSSFALAYYVDSLGANGFNIPGPAPLSNVGQAVSAADINGDGKADIVFNNQNGFAYVVFGASNFSSTYNLAALNGVNGFAIVGAASGNKMSLTTGDVNGDGRSDIIASTPDQAQGIVYVVFGSPSFAPQFNVSSLNGSNGFSIKGTATARTLGVSIATGDVNGDHIADLIFAESDSACVSGSAYVIYGKADFSSDAAFNLTALDGINGYKIINIPGCDSQGFTVSTADVDGNGRDDVLIGSGAQVSGAEAWIILS